MKRIALCVLAAMLMLSGCVAAPVEPVQGNAPGDETTAAIPDETKETTTPSFPEGSPEVIPALLAKHQKTIHVVKPNWNRDIYPDSSSCYMSLDVLSDIPLKEEDVTVTLPIDLDVTVILNERDIGDTPSQLEAMPSGLGGFSYDTYLHYWGMDCTELAAKHNAMTDARAALIAERNPTNEAAYRQASNDYNEFYNTHYDDYIHLTRKMLPQFYRYQVTFRIDPTLCKKDSVFRDLILTIKGEEFPVDIGELRLHTKNALESHDRSFAIDLAFASIHPLHDLDGSITVNDLDGMVEEAVTLTGFEYLSNGPQPTDVRLYLYSNSTVGNKLIDWNEPTPIEVNKGKHISIEMVFEDPILEKTAYEISGFVILEYEANGVSYREGYEACYTHEYQAYDLYAELFDGIDFTQYYEVFYNPCILGLES